MWELAWDSLWLMGSRNPLTGPAAPLVPLTLAKDLYDIGPSLRSRKAQGGGQVGSAGAALAHQQHRWPLRGHGHSPAAVS